MKYPLQDQTQNEPSYLPSWHVEQVNVSSIWLRVANDVLLHKFYYAHTLVPVMLNMKSELFEQDAKHSLF